MNNTEVDSTALKRTSRGIKKFINLSLVVLAVVLSIPACSPREEAGDAGKAPVPQSAETQRAAESQRAEEPQSTAETESAAEPIPQPLSRQSVEQVRPAVTVEAPVITIISHSQLDYYSSRETVRGVVSDPEQIESLRWRILGTQLGDELDFDSRGNYSFSFSTLQLPSIVHVELRAVNEQGLSALQTLVLIDDGRGPAITIVSPRNWDYYGPTVTVEGTVRDSTSLLDMESLSWEVEHSALGGRLVLDEQGRFDFEFPTEGLPAVASLILKAGDRKGNLSKRALTLLESRRGPLLTINSPSDGGTCSSVVKVEGEVSDPDDLSSLSWEVTGSGLGSVLKADREGRFQFELSTFQLADTFEVVIHAQNKRGRRAERVLILMRDKIPPWIEILSPVEGQAFGEEIAVRGRIGDEGFAAGDPSEVKSFTWQLLSSPDLKGDISYSTKGAFSFRIPTAGLSGTQILELRADDKTGNATVATVALVDNRQVSARTATAAAIEPAKAAEGPPFVSISSPENKSYYSSEMLVKGRVGNAVTDESTDTIRSLRWKLAASSRFEKILFDENGTFAFRLSTIGLHGTQIVQVIAESLGGLESEAVLILLDDEKGPALSLSRAGARNYYREQIVVEGTVSNSEQDTHSISEVKSLFCRVEGTPALEGPVLFESEGSFRIALPAQGLNGRQTVHLTAEDLNGNFTRSSLTVYDGNIAPRIVVTSPSEGHVYGSNVEVRGTVEDPYGDVESMRGIESLTYRISSAEIFQVAGEADQREVQLGADRAFSFVVSTRGLEGPQELHLEARAANGNTGMKTIRMIQGESDIPSFTITPADGRMTLRWDPVATAISYNIHYHTENFGEGPGEEQRIEDVRSPCELSGLENGNLYAFRLQARLPGEQDSWSSVKRAVPLSPDTLLPTAVGEYQQIRLSWLDIPATGSYEIWRSASSRQALEMIASDVTETVYLDTDVRFAETYYYEIRPSGFSGAASRVVKARSLAFPEKKMEVSGTLRLADVRKICLYGGYAYIAGGAQGITIVDISNPADPLPVGRCETADANDVIVRGYYAYVADGQRGLKILDVADPRNPVQVGARKTSDARSVVVRGDYAFIADGRRGIKVVDVSNPVDPLRVASLKSSDARDIALRGNDLFLADGRGGLRTIDVSDPLSPVEKGAMPTDNALSLSLQGELLFLADGEQGLKIIDISTAETPVCAGSYDTGYAVDVAAGRQLAYVADGEQGVKIFDVSEPGHPVQFAEQAIGNAQAISIRNNHVYIAGDGELKIVRILVQGNSYSVAFCNTGNKAFRVTSAGNRAFVVGHGGGVSVVDVLDPLSVNDRSRSSVLEVDYALDIAVKDRIVYVADKRRGIKILQMDAAADSSDPGGFREIASLYTGGSAYSVALGDELLFVADGREGCKIIDVSDPGNPIETAVAETRDARDVALFGSALVVVADRREGMVLFDASDPTAPARVSTIAGREGRRVAVQKNLAYFVSSSGLSVIDLSNPRAPKRVSHYATDYGEEIAVAGKYAYLAEGYRGLSVLDISNPERPRVVSVCADVYAAGVDVADGYALVADSKGLHIVQVLIPDWLLR